MNISGSPARVLLGTLLLSTANVSRIAIQFLLVPILARLLGPKVFGIMSVAMSFILFANVLTDAGLGAALVRQSDADHELRSTIFWVSFLIGTSLAVLLCIVSWPIAAMFGQPGLAPVLCALSPILLISAALSVSNAQIVRSQRFDIFAAGELGCAISSAAIGISMAALGYGVWSLVGQQLLLWVTKAVWVLWIAGFRPAFALRLKRARPLLRFSLNNLAANITDFVGKSAPLLIVSGSLGIAAAGQYSMGYQLTRVADMVVSSPVNVTTFSAVAVAPNRRAAAIFVLAALRILTMVLGALCAGLMLTADLATPLLLGPKWIETAPVLAALAPGSLLVCLFGFVSSALLGRGRSGQVFKLTLITSIVISAATWLGARGGVAWAASGFSLGTALVTPLYIWCLARALQVPMARLASAIAANAAAVAFMCVCVVLVRFEIQGASQIVQLAIAVAVGVVSFVAAAWLLDGNQIRADAALLWDTSPEGMPAGSSLAR